MLFLWKEEPQELLDKSRVRHNQSCESKDPMGTCSTVIMGYGMGIYKCSLLCREQVKGYIVSYSHY